jgi:hypothetical protein
MEISQGNPLCSYLYLKQAKLSFFSFSFSFFFYKIREQVLPKGVVGTSGRMEVVGKESRMVTVVKNVYTCM